MSTEGDGDEVHVGEVEMVLRRAAEIQANSAETDGLVPTRDVVQMAQELGISRNAVDRALVELRSGELERARRPRGLGERLWAPRELVCVRTVPGPVEEVDAALRAFLTSQGFTIQRNFGDELLWKQERTLWESLRSLFDSSAHKLRGCSEVSTSVVPGDGQNTARLVVRMGLGELRGAAKTNALAGGGGVGGLVLAASALASVLAGVVWLPLGVLAAVGIGYGFTRSTVSSYRKHVRQLEQNVEGFVDRIEHDRPALPDRTG